MSEPILIPKFLTKGMVARIIGLVVGMVMDDAFFPLKRRMLHIVVLVPAMRDDRISSFPKWPNYPIYPHLLYEYSLGDKSEWPHKFDEIAEYKALQLWHGRNDDRTDIMPHLLFPGDTPYWGGVKRHGIVVTCSGVQPWFDKMISGLIADACIAMSYDRWMALEAKEKNVDFLA